MACCCNTPPPPSSQTGFHRCALDRRSLRFLNLMHSSWQKVSGILSSS